MYNPEKLTRRGNEHAIHACVTQFSRLFTIFFSLLFVFPPCKFSSPYAPVYTRIIYIYLKCSSHGPAAIFTPAAPPLFTYLLMDYGEFSRDEFTRFLPTRKLFYLPADRRRNRPNLSNIGVPLTKNVSRCFINFPFNLNV